MKPGTVATLALAGLVLAGCGGPRYVEIEEKTALAISVGSEDVAYRLDAAYRERPPRCIAVMPFTAAANAGAESRLRSEGLVAVRRAVYGHLSLQAKRDVELGRVDFVLSRLGRGEIADPIRIGGRLRCDALLFGEVVEYGATFLGIYSRVSVGARVKLVRARDGRTLWEAGHIAASHGGAVPMSPVGLAMGVIDAALNMDGENLLSLTDDLARRLIKALPDDGTVMVQDPTRPAPRYVQALKGDGRIAAAEAFLAEIEPLPPASRRARLVAAIESGRYRGSAGHRLHAALIEIAPDEPGAHNRYAAFLLAEGDYGGALAATDRALALDENASPTLFLKGRILLRANRIAEAEGPLLHAVALAPDEADYLNGLGYAYSLSGRVDEALAAYAMSLDRRPVNGFAYYNVGVALFNRGDLKSAREAFYRAGLAYYRDGRFDLTTRAAADLRLIGARGVPVAKRLARLESALGKLSNPEKKDV